MDSMSLESGADSSFLKIDFRAKIARIFCSTKVRFIANPIISFGFSYIYMLSYANFILNLSIFWLRRQFWPKQGKIICLRQCIRQNKACWSSITRSKEVLLSRITEIHSHDKNKFAAISVFLELPKLLLDLNLNILSIGIFDGKLFDPVFFCSLKKFLAPRAYLRQFLKVLLSAPYIHPAIFLSSIELVFLNKSPGCTERY